MSTMTLPEPTILDDDFLARVGHSEHVWVVVYEGFSEPVFAASSFLDVVRVAKRMWVVYSEIEGLLGVEVEESVGGMACLIYRVRSHPFVRTLIARGYKTEVCRA